MYRTMKMITEIYAIIVLGSILIGVLGIGIYGIIAIIHGKIVSGIIAILIGIFLYKNGIKCVKEVRRK